MKKFIFLILTFLFSVTAFSQEGQKINAGIDMSFGLHYFNSDVNNPLSYGVNVGYEYSFLFFFGIEAGIKAGGFNQKVGYEKGPTMTPTSAMPTGADAMIRDVYRGTYWAPYIAPKIYFPIAHNEKHDRGQYIFLENRFSYTTMRLDLDRIEGLSGDKTKGRFQYEIRAGYQFPVTNRWAISGWIGYNTFDFSSIKPESIRFKNTTPLELGIGFSYIIKE